MTTSKTPAKKARAWSPPSANELGLTLFTLDRRLRYAWCSSSYLALIGKETRVVVGLPFETVHPNAKGSEILTALKTARTNTPTKVSDYCVQLGTWFEFQITVQERQILVLVTDVTERFQSDLTLKKAADAMRASLDGCFIGIARLGLDGQWLEMNPRCREITGVEDLDAGSFKDIMTSKQRSSDQTHFAELIEDRRKIFSSDRQIICANGSKKWVQLKIALVRGDQGQPRFFVASFDDIGERKEAEDSLQFALEASQMADWDFDAINNVTRRSKRFDAIFGYSVPLPQWGYEEFLSHVHPEDRSMVERKFRKALSQGRNCQIETRILWPDHSLHWISLRGRAYLNDEGRTVRMAGLVMDITPEKIAEREIQNARLAAEDANREKSYFLANMSHEIRTPLGAILGFTEILNEPTLPKEERLRYLQIINRNGKGLAKLIDDILDLSKVEAGFLEVENAPVKITDLLEEVTGLLKVKADAKNLKLSVRSDGTIPKTVMGDAIRLRQILINVIGNAIKFTDVGTVSVTVKCVGQELGFSIQDSGLGIPEDARARIFQPFTQADSSTSRKFGGTGLGLALSRRLAVAMGGNLVLEKSSPEAGSVFLLTIPVVLPSEKDGNLTQPTAPAPKAGDPIGTSPMRKLNGLRVLLAEDSPDNQVLIRRLLDKKGVEIDIAADGVIAVEKAQSEHYDVVLMDMQMPRLDGYEATKVLRERGYARPIVALTAHAMRHDRMKCLEAGCTEYLSKPIEPAQLYRIVAEVAEQIDHQVGSH